MNNISIKKLIFACLLGLSVLSSIVQADDRPPGFDSLTPEQQQQALDAAQAIYQGVMAQHEIIKQSIKTGRTNPKYLTNEEKKLINEHSAKKIAEERADLMLKDMVNLLSGYNN